MSNTISISDVAEALKKHHIAPPDQRAIIEDLNKVVAKAEAAKPEPAPKSKKQFVVLATLERTQAWVLQIDEDEAPGAVTAMLNDAAHTFNASKKGRLIPVKTLGQACESVPRKFLKEVGLKVCTKTPVPIIAVPNQLGEAPSV